MEDTLFISERVVMERSNFYEQCDENWRFYGSALGVLVTLNYFVKSSLYVQTILQYKTMFLVSSLCTVKVLVEDSRDLSGVKYLQKAAVMIGTVQESEEQLIVQISLLLYTKIKFAIMSQHCCNLF